jgi:FkbH-like protein
MMKNEPINLSLEFQSYFEIIKKQNKPRQNSLKTIRLAFLADCSLQHLSKVLTILGNESGIELDIYSGNFDSIEMEVIDLNSKFYAFNAEYVVIIQQSQKLKSRLYATSNSQAVDQIVANITTIWDAIRKNLNVPIIQSTFLTPAERAFGNYELMVSNSLGSRIREINNRIIEEAKVRKDIFINDIDFLASEYGRKSWRDEKLWLMAKTPCSLEAMPTLSKNILDIILASTGRLIKCVILDLDNTLWGGVIGDDGLEGIRLGDFEDGDAFLQLQLFALALKNRGIILAVCSKNEIDNALSPFKHHPEMILKEMDIAAFIANWNDKASNISEIQRILNIGFDSMVFLDDNPFERNLVRGMLPTVIVPELPDDPANYVAYLATLNLFEATTFSNADLERSELYRVEAQRLKLKSNFKSVNEYLTSLEMTINLERFNTFNLPRIAQLIQRSNQFNLTTKRYSEAECESLSKDF